MDHPPAFAPAPVTVPGRLPAGRVAARMTRWIALAGAILAAPGRGTTAQPDAPAGPAFETTLTADDLDPAAFAERVGGTEAPPAVANGPRHVLWTRTTAPEWDGVRFGDTKQAGPRHLRIGFRRPIPVGSVLARAGGQLAVLRPEATYPGDLADETQWVPARRLAGEHVSGDEAGREDYVVWVLPPGTTTRALRFTHVAALADPSYAGWLGGASVLAGRYANVAPQATATAGDRNEAASRINNGSNDGTWGIWDNGPEGAARPVSAEHPAWVMLTWPREVRLCGLNALWAGFGAVEVQAFHGPPGRHPREATEADWRTVKTFDTIENQYPRALGLNGMDFGRPVTTRALRLRITAVTKEAHPHMIGNTRGGKRVWLGELLALRPLDESDLMAAVAPAAAAPAPHPPIPVHFTLKEAGYVTLVIEGMDGQRVRNLIAETPFPAGPNVTWWDGLDDLLRDDEAARHGLYHIPARFVPPGSYRVRGLVRKGLDLRYEFSVYSAGNPPWPTADHAGGWLANHTPPSAALFVPAVTAPGGKPLVYLGSYVSEGGDGLAWVDLDGRKQGGQGWVGGNWTGAPYLARDDGAQAVPGTHAYAGSAWEGDLRLTALTRGGDKPVVKYTFEGGKDASALTGLAVRDGVLACSLPKQKKLLFVSAPMAMPLGTVPLDDPRGLAFDARGRLLALSGTTLVRLPALSELMATLDDAVVPLDRKDWTLSPVANAAKARDALDGKPDSRWDTGTEQVPGQSFTLDLGSSRPFTTLVLKGDASDYPRGYEVSVSSDGRDWGKPLATGAGTPGDLVFAVPRTTARYLKVVQTGRAPNYWSVYELNVYDTPPPPPPPPPLAARRRPAPEVLVSQGLDDPQQLALDPRGNLYISDRGESHQVKVFTPEGKPLRMIGHPGAPRAGPYDPDHMNNPNGLTIDGNDRLWVAETDFQPKRISVWTLDGQRVKAFYGPAEYGGGGALDPRDRSRFYYHGMEFRLDWDKGTDQLTAVLFRPGPKDLPLPDGFGVGGQPETALYRDGRRYFTNCYNSNPTNGTNLAILWRDRDGLAVPAAALGMANGWDVLKGDAFRPRWPAGINLKGEPGQNQTLFAWSDLDGDAHIQPEEVAFAKQAGVGGITVMPDLAFVAARVDDRTTRFAPVKFTAEGVPVYDLAAGKPLVAGVQGPASSGGDQALVAPDGRVVLTVAPKPFAPQSVCGAVGGVPMWSYPSPWPGLHASHESAAPDRPGQLIGTTRLLGGFVTPRGGDAGPCWAINGNMGNIYLLTADGLFVATLFRDVRQGQPWSMPIAGRGMKLNDLTLHDENFWPSLNQTADGKVYLVAGNPDLVRVDGLETIQRLDPGTLRLTGEDLRRAQSYLVEDEARRQQAQGRGTLDVPLRPAAPVVDGALDDWAGASWADIDKRGVAANFNSNSKPYDVTAAVAVAGDRLYAAFRTGDPTLLRNSGEVPLAPFKTGGALDLMIGADPTANPDRTAPVAGDVRLLVTMVKGKPLALLYRAVVAGPGAKAPVPFSSPWRTITFDRVDDVTAEVRLAGKDGDYELSAPLSTLGLAPAPGQTHRADVGLLRGDGSLTLQRVYWQNKATGITADVPSEAMLTPNLWGRWRFAVPAEPASP